MHRVKQAGAVADCLHNLAYYSSVNFEGFDQELFWRDVENTRLKFPSTEWIRGSFDDQIRRLASGEGPWLTGFWPVRSNDS